MAKTVETTYRALILRVMVTMMQSDGRIDDQEFEQICDIYEEIIGFRLPSTTRKTLINSAVSTRKEVLHLLRTYGHRLRASHREKIIRAGLYVLEADARTDPREREFLMQVGLALGLDWAATNAIVDAARAEGGTRFKGRT
jgi:tellurite resistance protein